MRHSLWVALVLAVGMLFPRPTLAATYAAGWNLVAGPDGSQLTGATGKIYTLQPGDSDYESFPADSPLKGCVGYWAYFPSGGSIVFGTGGAACSISPAAGQYVMTGNPSATGSATLVGADYAYTYSPSTGYQQATIVPPGQGVLLTASGVVSLTVSPSAPVTQHLLSVSGQGADDSTNFTLTSTTLSGCVTVSSTTTDPSDVFLYFSLERSSDKEPVYVSDFVLDAGTVCKTFHAPSLGSYYIHIGASFATKWMFTLDQQ